MQEAWRTIKRFVLSCSSLGITFLVFLVAYLDNQPRSCSPLIIYVLYTGIGVLVLQAFFDYQKRTYDSTLALKFQDIWNTDKSAGLRYKAAKAIRDKKEHLEEIEQYKVALDPIDDVLDILIDIGFLLEGDQISSQVVHHYFYHWIKGYWCSAHAYVEAKQAKERKTLWRQLKLIFEATTFIECLKNRSREKLWENDTSEFLNEEMRLIGQSQRP